VAFEIAAGNLNFAKRYGQIHVNVHDGASGAAEAIDSPITTPGVSRSAFNPSLSDDGQTLAFSAVGPSGNTVIWVRRAGTKTAAVATPRPGEAPAGDAYGGRLSGDGRRLVFTWVPRDGSASRVYLTDLATGVATLVDHPTGGSSAQPAVSADGRFVAFSRGARVYVRDMTGGTTTAVGDAGRGAAFEPVISADGTRVAYTSTRSGRSRVLLSDRATAKTTVVTAGPGISFDPSLSGNGERVAFASNRRDLAPTRSAGARSVYVFDVGSGRTTLVSGGPAAQ
jgi:Tol biopolymer transport system component